MALQTFTAGQVLTAAQVTALQTNDFNQTVSTKTANYVLVAADKGTRVEMNAAGATTITVNTSLFNAGDTLFIQNRGAGTTTVTAGTATVSGATLAVAQFQGGTLYFVSAGVAIFFLVGSSGVSALKDADISGTTGSPSTATYTESSVNYKSYTFTGSGSITFSKAGLVDVLVVGAGGAGRATSYGGGAGGLLTLTNFFVTASTKTVTIGAAVTGASADRGFDTRFAELTGVGGGNGGAAGSNNGQVGGSAGGGPAGGGGACHVSGQGNAGGNTGSGGAGGGSGGAAGPTTAGVGTSNSLRAGTPVTYAAGGVNGGGSGAANTGNGAGGSSTANTSGSGIVIVRVLA